MDGDNPGVGDDDGGVPPAVPAERSVRFAFEPPRDITGEGISFVGAADSEEKVSVEGIIEYGKGAVPADVDSSNVETARMRRRKGLDRRKSSLESRRNIPAGLLLTEGEFHAITGETGVDGNGVNRKSRRFSQIRTYGRFRSLFMNPSYSLRKQMLLTFGSVSSLTILLVMIVAIVSSIVTGDSIKEKSSKNLETWVDEFMGTVSRYAAEALSPKIMPTDLIDLMVEIARDRFAGYPIAEDDSLTPFFDMQSQTNVYPLKNNPLPLDWDFRHTPNEREGNVNEENFVEHVQGRWPWYSANPRLSTEIAMYTMQGACDPRATDPSVMEYYPNCTDDNNDITTGGVLAPNPTNEQVYRKAADLSPFLKALYEYEYVKQLGYYFSNSGAGSSIFFPHYELDSSRSYVSIGCEWMRAPNPINPTLGPIGTDEEIARCHPENATVPTREYNPLERAWCRDQALNPQRVRNIGPYVDAWAADKRWLITVGKAIYDLVTDAFVSCIAVDFTIERINEILEEMKIDDLGTFTLVRNDDFGTVVTSPKFDFDNADDTTTIDDPNLETGVDWETFDEIKSTVDFSLGWDPEAAARSYATARFYTAENIISAYPIPSIPDEYDSTYVPEFFAVFSLTTEEALEPIIQQVNDKIDGSMKTTFLITLLVGIGGLAIVISFIFVSASWFVEPLKWMQSVGDQVVGKFGQEFDSSIDYERKKSLRCSPKTELSSLAEEFSKMVARFSGEGTAKRVQVAGTEKLNTFDFAGEFSGLYRSREDNSFGFKYPNSSPASDEGQVPEQCNLGPNIRPSLKSAPSSSTSGTTDYGGKVHKSPVFLWMVGLIVSPTLITTVAISAIVMWQISELPSLIEPVREEYVNLKDRYRFSLTGMLAVHSSAVSERAARDAHLLNRFASWLYFGGMEVSGSFTEVIEGAEECKTALNSSKCEWDKDKLCDCTWNDQSPPGKNGSCSIYPPGESRTLQKVHFEGQSQDVGPDGSRYFTSFPQVATFPNTTAWWDNTTVLPNTSEESMSTKYDTTHERVKIASSLSTVFIPLYNYDTSSSKPLGTYVAFEADGMFAGYTGCKYVAKMYPFWRSSEENGAAMIRPELCPLNKYGYDPRCRGWYDEGKQKAVAGNGTFHLTAPYVFGDEELVGQSLTMPLIDPRNKKHIGQVLVDFLPGSLFRALKSSKTKLSQGGFPLLITPEKDVLGHDTVVGPGISPKAKGGKSIQDILPYAAFQPILQDMKAGERGNDTFPYYGPSGEGTIHIAYAPVFVRNYHPQNSSDIASGVKNKTTLIYSLALLETENGLTKLFTNAFNSNTVEICIAVLGTLIAISTILIIFIAFRETTVMSVPVLKLLDVMKDINSNRVSNDDMNKLSNSAGSCREIDSVYKTMEMLYRVVQVGNTAFFSGDLEVAHELLRDALHLFMRLDNKKAIAVASNNLGNTMLIIYRTMKRLGSEEMCGLSKKEVINKGTAYFGHSIKLGEEAYDEFYNKQGWSEECLAFMQFLANRYFNRAVFFLTTSPDNEKRKEAESSGFRDLQITADMDVEIVDQCLEMGFKINRVERYDLMMSRVRGLLSLVELGYYSPDELFIEDQISDVYQDLKNAMKNPSHELFKDISVAGRMQKLDVELIKFFSLAKKDNVNAARAAVRMLIEDEYIFLEAEQRAIMMLLNYMNTTNDENYSADEKDHMEKELRSIVGTLENELFIRQSSLSIREGKMRALDIPIKPAVDQGDLGSSEELVGVRRSKIQTKSKSERRRSSAMKESIKGDVVMELF